MKVLEPGREQKGWAVQQRCTGKGNGGGGCNALLLVDEGDLFLTFHHVRNETDTFVTFKCVCCGVLTDLTTEPPRNIIAKLPTQAAHEAATKTNGG